MLNSILGWVGAQHRGQGVHVAGPDVALIGARVHGDAPGAGGDGVARRPEDVRPGALARVAEQRDLVDVDGEHGHGSGSGAATRRRGPRGPV